VLCHDQRIALDGSPAETVDAEAKDLATKQLAQLAARKAAAPAVAKRKPAPKPPIPPKTPEQLRDRVRAAPLAGALNRVCRLQDRAQSPANGNRRQHLKCRPGESRRQHRSQRSGHHEADWFLGELRTRKNCPAWGGSSPLGPPPEGRREYDE